MSCVIWTEPAIEAACREWYVLREMIRVDHKQLLKERRLLEAADALAVLEQAAIEALGTTIERAVRLRDLDVSVLLQPHGGLYVHDPKLRSSDESDWNVY